MKIKKLVEYICSLLLIFSLVACACIEFYFFILCKDKPFVFAYMNNVDRFLYIALFVFLGVMAIMLFVFLAMSNEQEDNYKNYEVVDKDLYHSMEKKLLAQEYENMHQDLKIAKLKVKLSSYKLKMQIFKKIFKHKK